MNNDFAGVQRLDESILDKSIQHEQIVLPNEFPRKPPKSTGKPYPPTRGFKKKEIDTQ